MLLWTPNSLELLPDLLVSFECIHSVEIWEFAATQILRETNFGHIEAPSKIAILTILVLNS